MDHLNIALIGNVASLGYLIGSELEKRGASVDYYCVPNVFTTPPRPGSTVELGKVRNIPLERTLRKIWVKGRSKTYDVEIRLSSAPFVKSRNSIMIFNGTELRTKTMLPEARCFVTTKDLLGYVGKDIDARFLPRCIDTSAFSRIRKGRGRDDGKMLVGHFPTDQKIKGSDLVSRAVKHLQSEGVNCELISQIVPHDEMPQYLASIDVLCDWFGSEAIYGIVSVEALAVGTPVVCYVDDRYYDYPEMKQWIQTCQLTPESVADAILKAMNRQIDSRRVQELYSPGRTVDALLDALVDWEMIN